MTGSTPAIDINAYRRYIEDALEYAGHSHTFDDVVEMVASGEAQFWPGPNSCIVTEIVIHPRRKVIHVFLAGGSLPEIEAMVPILETWAREHGCTSASLDGRPGWERTFLVRQGWTKSPRVTMEKDLTTDVR